MDIVQDYLAVRKAGLALAVIAFLIGVARMGATDQPHERSRAQHLLALAAVAFVVLAGDRMLAQGIAGWFGLSHSSLPAFWQ